MNQAHHYVGGGDRPAIRTQVEYTKPRDMKKLSIVWSDPPEDDETWTHPKEQLPQKIEKRDRKPKFVPQNTPKYELYPDQAAEIVRRFNEGETLYDAARAFGWSSAAGRRALIAAGVDPQRRIPPEIKRQIIEMTKNYPGLPQKDIGKRFGISQSMVSRVVTSHRSEGI